MQCNAGIALHLHGWGSDDATTRRTERVPLLALFSSDIHRLCLVGKIWAWFSSPILPQISLYKKKILRHIKMSANT
jgi:hypothetical protein